MQRLAIPMTAMLHSVETSLGDCSYEEKVLLTLKGSSEAELDAQLASEAQQLGIQFPSPSTRFLFHSGPDEPSEKNNLSASPSRCASFDSRHSPSASINSGLSWSLNDTPLQNVYSSGFSSISRPSLSDQIENGYTKPPSYHRLSSSSSSYAMSLPPTSLGYTIEEEATRKPFSVRRGLNRLSGKPKRTTQQTVGRGRILCQSCPEYAAPPKQIFILRCKHAVCRLHLRELVLQFVNSEDQEAPHCCGRPISRSHIQSVTSENEEAQLVSRLPSSRASIASSSASRPTSQIAHSRNASVQSVTNGLMSNIELTPQDFEQILDQAIENSIVEYQDQRRLERDRFIKFYAAEREDIQNRYKREREAHVDDFSNQIEQIQDSIPVKVAALEDEHVVEEMELMRAQEIEGRTASVALRYKEAYCAGHDPEGTGRTVTQQDRMELDRQRHVCDTLDKRHQAAINVLRQQQGRQVRLESQKLERQVAVLERRRDREIKELDQIYEIERKQANQVTAGRAERLIIRWNLKDMILKAQQQRAKEDADRELSGVFNFLKLGALPAGIEQACS